MAEEKLFRQVVNDDGTIEYQEVKTKDVKKETEEEEKKETKKSAGSWIKDHWVGLLAGGILGAAGVGVTIAAIDGAKSRKAKEAQAALPDYGRYSDADEDDDDTPEVQFYDMPAEGDSEQSE